MRLGDVCTKIGSGATPKGGKEAYKPSGIPLIRSQNVLDWSFTSNGLAFVDEGQAAALANVEVEPRDILLNITGDSVARACMVPDWCTPARVNQHVSIVRPGPDLDPTFLLCYLQSSKPLLLKLASSGATRNALTKGMIGDLEIELPNIETQRAIASLIGQIQQKIVLNQQTNDYLAELCELIVSRSEATDGALSDICTQVTDKVSCIEAQIDSYVSTESLLADKNGRQLAASVPQTGKVVVYKAGDTLVSNIRPYFKKIWFAENDGTCSGDVVVFRANNPFLAPYLYAILRSDKFFDYVMSGAKGTKMPRGDKKQMMSYGINPYCPERDLEIIAFAVYGIGASNQENQYLSSLRDSLLPKLMSGEIDTSKVELPTLPNNHLPEHRPATSELFPPSQGKGDLDGSDDQYGPISDAASPRLSATKAIKNSARKHSVQPCRKQRAQ